MGVNLFTRPRRFGKSLNMDMLKTFFKIDTNPFFTGLNHFKVRTISDVDCAEYFGFTDIEVKEMLRYYNVEDRFPDIKEWYNGYHFASVDVYCPWDVINQCDKLRVKKDASMESHWENSSSNMIIQELIEGSTESTKAEIESLISGELIEKHLIPELTYADLDSTDPDIRQANLCSMLFSTGYLTDANEPNGKNIH